MFSLSVEIFDFFISQGGLKIGVKGGGGRETFWTKTKSQKNSTKLRVTALRFGMAVA